MSTEPLNSYSQVVQWATVRLMLILQCVLGFQSRIIDFANIFSQEYIPSGRPVFIGIPSYFKSGGGQYSDFIRLKKVLYCQAKAAHLWYEIFSNSLLNCDFVVS